MKKDVLDTVIILSVSIAVFGLFMAFLLFWYDTPREGFVTAGVIIMDIALLILLKVRGNI